MVVIVISLFIVTTLSNTLRKYARDRMCDAIASSCHHSNIRLLRDWKEAARRLEMTSYPLSCITSSAFHIKLPSTKISSLAFSLQSWSMMFCCAIELNIHFDELIQFDKSWGIMDTFLSRIIHEDEWRQVICNICNNSNQLKPDSGLLDTAHIASWSVKSFNKDFLGFLI